MDINFFVKIARSFLGLILLIFGFNFFFNFMNINLPPGVATDFLQSLASTKYFIPMLGAVHIIFGFLLISNIFVPLLLLLLLPLNINIFLFNIFVAPNNLSISSVMIASHIFLLYMYKDNYKQLLKL